MDLADEDNDRTLEDALAFAQEHGDRSTGEALRRSLREAGYPDDIVDEAIAGWSRERSARAVAKLSATGRLDNVR